MADCNAELKVLFTGYWNYMAISAACKIGLFDAIRSGKNSKADIRPALNVPEPALDALLKVCEQEGLISIDPRITLTGKGEILTENHTQSLKWACIHWSEEPLTAWQGLDYSLLTGQSSFERKYGQSYFSFLSDNPDKLRDYHKAMFEYARDDYRDICSKFDFGRHSSIMDVGGGYGALIKYIKANHPSAQCTLFDLPEVIREVQLSDIALRGGNFMEEVPALAEAVILSRVIHDWEDSQAEIILRNVFQSLPVNGTLYLIENLPERMENHASSLTLNMLVLCKSHERTLEQYQSLLFQAGFRFKSLVQLNSTQYILIATK